MTGKLLYLLPLAAILAGCAIPPTHPSLRGADLPPLLPVRKFVAAMDAQGGHAVSPDGLKLLRTGGDAVEVRDIASGATRRFPASTGTVSWAGDSRHLVYEEARGDDGGRHLLLLDSARPGALPVDLTPWKDSQSYLLHAGARPVFLSSRRAPGLFDAYSVDPATMSVELLLRNPGDMSGVVTDIDGSLGARIRRQDENFILQVLDKAAGTWHSAYRWSQSDTVQPLYVDRARKRLLMISNAGRDKAALVELSLGSGRQRVLSSHPDVDLHHAVLDPDGKPVAVWYDPDLPRSMLLDRAAQQQLQRLLPDGVKTWRLTSADRGARRAVVKMYADRGMLEGLFDRDADSLTLLSDSRKEPALQALVSTRPVSFQAGDGRTLHGYLTLPQTARRPLPMLVWVHGGPWQRSYWQPSDLHAPAQFYANRGYAVLDVNYRGSRGYGRAHMEAAVGELAGRLQQDIADGVDWAVAEGIADPQRLAIAGAGFGGYSTLLGLTAPSSRYACGMDIVGTADLGAALETMPAQQRQLWQRYANGGEGLPDLSPLYRADRIRVPLLVVQGARDVPALLDQSDRLVRALRAQQKPVQYLLFADEGTPVRQPENRVRMYRQIEDFLAGCLGGRSGGASLTLR